jgi:enoyl-CoA hydratase/carnithine racemase
MTYENIIYSVNEKKAIITFNRPKLHNALSYKMIEEIKLALEQASSDKEVRVIILTGKGESFCSGDDMRSMSEERRNALSADVPMPVTKGWMMAKGYEQVVIAIRNTPKPVIASVKGHALGAGCDIMLACDFRVISENANMGLVYVQRAFASGILSVLFHLGLAKATELLFTGKTFSTKEALALGLVNVVSTDEKLIEDTFSFADRFIDMPTASIGIIKEGLNEIINFEKLAELQSRMYCKNMVTEDIKEGAKAFFEKRTPNFKGY